MKYESNEGSTHHQMEQTYSKYVESIVVSNQDRHPWRGRLQCKERANSIQQRQYKMTVAGATQVRMILKFHLRMMGTTGFYIHFSKRSPRPQDK